MLIGNSEAYPSQGWIGKLDDIRIYNRALSEAEIDSLYHEGGWDIDPSVAHWTFDEMAGDTLHDVSWNGNHGIINGAAWVEGAKGGALYFDGVDSYVEVPHHDAFNFSTAFTIEVLVKVVGTSISGCGIVSRWETGPDEAKSFHLGATHEGVINFMIQTDLTGDNVNILSSDTLSVADPIRHIAAVYDGSEIRVYVDHHLSGSTPVSGDVSDSVQPTAIGASGSTYGGGFTSDFEGLIDEVRISNVALSPVEFLEFEPLDTSLVAYYPFNGNANDESGNGNHGTVYGTTLVPDRFGNDSSAFSFNGAVDNYIINNPIGNFPSTEITASFWMLSSDTTHLGTPLSYASSSAENMFLVVDYKNFEINVNNVSSDDIGVSANDGIWRHMAVTWKSLDGEVKVHKDGLLSFSGILSAGASMENGGSLVFGQEQDIVGGSFQSYQAFIGVLDDIRIYNRALSAVEIDSLYHEGGWALSDTTAPATPTGFTVTPGDQQVIFTWTPNTEPDFLRYRVYMSTPPFSITLIDSTNDILDTTRTISGLVNGAIYTFYLTAVDTNLNESELTAGIEATPGVISTTSNVAIPRKFALHPAYPNPFNPSTTVKFDLPEAADVSLIVYDIMGREVARLVDRPMAVGYHSMVWDARDARGREVPTGIYIARLVTPEYTKSIKLALLK